MRTVLTEAKYPCLICVLDVACSFHLASLRTRNLRSISSPLIGICWLESVIPLLVHKDGGVNQKAKSQEDQCAKDKRDDPLCLLLLQLLTLLAVQFALLAHNAISILVDFSFMT